MQKMQKEMLNIKGKNMNLVKAYVQANAHCNLDSLPLRFGFYFQKDEYIELEAIGDIQPGKVPGRFMVEAWITNPNTDEKISGKFVLTDSKKNGSHTLVTAWRMEDDEEFYFSEVIKMLRLKGAVSPEWLLENHRLYASGVLRSHADLVFLLASKVGKEEAEVLRAHIKSQEDRIKRLLQSMKDGHKEIAQADTEKSSVTIVARGVLKKVVENVVHKGSYCTAIDLDDGTRLFMKTATFDKTGEITRKAHSLVGEKVRVVCWDPKNAPGKWSSLGYFRNLYLDQISH